MRQVKNEIVEGTSVTADHREHCFDARGRCGSRPEQSVDLIFVLNDLVAQAPIIAELIEAATILTLGAGAAGAVAADVMLDRRCSL